MRVACVFAPQMALQAILRRNPECWEQRTQPVALAAKSGERARIVGVTAAAADAGIYCNQTVHQARATAASRGVVLRVETRSETDTTAAQAALVDVGFSYAARTQSEPERVFFDISDLGRMYPAGERAIAQHIATRAARIGLAVRVGIASSKGIARVATQAGHQSIMTAGHESAQLAQLPVAAGMSLLATKERDQLSARLNNWGIQTLGDLAALQVAEVALRLGPEGASLHRIAQGLDNEPFAPQLPSDSIEEGLELDYGIESLEPLAFILRGLFDRVLARLACRNLACAGLTLRLKLEPKGFDVREVTVGAPCRDPAVLLQLTRLDLARRPPEAPVVGLEALARPARVQTVQMDLLRPAGPPPERMAATLARLQALVGQQNVGAPAVVNDHREEASACRAFSLPAADERQKLLYNPQAARFAGASTTTTLASMHRYRPPLPVEVIVGREGPLALRGHNIAVRLLVAAGPYRCDGDWWQENSFNRDYWDVHASDGAVYRVHQDCRSGHWYLNGYYD